MAEARDSQGRADPEVTNEPVPGDWPDVKRYLIRLVGVILIGVLMMAGTAIYYYIHYNGARAETTHRIPGYADHAR